MYFGEKKRPGRQREQGRERERVCVQVPTRKGDRKSDRNYVREREIEMLERKSDRNYVREREKQRCQRENYQKKKGREIVKTQ